MTENLTGVATKIDWSSLPGVILDGGYELKEVLDAHDDAAKVRVRILGSGGKTGLAYFLYLEPADAEDQLDIWRTLREAPQSNLSRPVAAGKLPVAGFETIYLVLADADEKLAAVVPERPLEWEEAAEVLHSCENALAHLHAHGLIHGSLSPQTVEAVGYSVQLNTASVRRLGKRPRVEWNKPQYLAPESKGFNLTTAADVWCLGATLFEVLAQHPYGTAGVELERGLPLAAVILRCVDRNPATRCALKEAPSVAQTIEPVTVEAAAVNPIQAEPTVTANPAAPAAETSRGQKSPPHARQMDDRVPGSGATRPRGTPANRIPQPLTPPRSPAKQVTKEDMALVPVGKRHRRVQRQPVGARIRTLDGAESESTATDPGMAMTAPGVSARILALGNKSTLMRNIVACVGLFLLFAAAVKFIIIPKLSSTEQPLTSNVSAQTAIDARAEGTPNGSLPAMPSSEASNGTANQPGASVPAQDDAPPVPVPVRRELFRVVLSSFPARIDAAREVESVSQKHPELIVRIEPMRAESGEIRYAVAVGGVLNRGEAEPLQQRLVGKGLKTAHLERVEKLTGGR